MWQYHAVYNWLSANWYQDHRVFVAVCMSVTVGSTAYAYHLQKWNPERLKKWRPWLLAATIAFSVASVMRMSITTKYDTVKTMFVGAVNYNAMAFLVNLTNGVECHDSWKLK